MKNTIKKLSGTKMSLIIVVAALITFAGSCSKSNNNNTTFTGNYYGTLVTSFYSEADTITITTGSTSSAVVMYTKTGRGSSYTINGTVSGSALNIPSQSVYINTLNANYTVTGSGTLKNSTLVLNYVFVSQSGSSTSLAFTGTKK